MKTLITSIGAVVVLGLAVLAPNAVYGQATSTTTTITSTGTVSELTPDAMVVKTVTSEAPLRYTFTKTTTYVDENGNPVSVETVKSGVPVTVFYEKQGDNFVADKVVVRKTVTTTDTTAPATMIAPAPATTTTTVTQPFTATQPLPTPPKAEGVVTDAGSGHIDLRTSTSAKPIHYKAHDATAFVDESGNPVPRKILTAGTPVTIFYEQDGDDLMATRVIVRSSALLEK